jgi:glycosyltransferase involved in cell wall biosynthesis
MRNGVRVAVVVPARNEARLLGRTLATMPGFVDHVVVVDDASDDGTAQVAEAFEDVRIEVLRHPRRRGVGGAIVTGYARAFAAGADVAAVMAGDAQMDPDDLARVVDPVTRGEADYCKGDRLSHPDAGRVMPRHRRLANHAFSRLTRLATGLPVQDSQCGYTAISRHAAESVRTEDMWSGYGYPNDLLGMLARTGLRVHQVTVRPIYGDETSGLRLHHGLVIVPWVLARAGARRFARALR